MSSDTLDRKKFAIWRISRCGIKSPTSPAFHSARLWGQGPADHGLSRSIAFAGPRDFTLGSGQGDQRPKRDHSRRRHQDRRSGLLRVLQQPHRPGRKDQRHPDQGREWHAGPGARHRHGSGQRCNSNVCRAGERPRGDLFADHQTGRRQHTGSDRRRPRQAARSSPKSPPARRSNSSTTNRCTSGRPSPICRRKGCWGPGSPA